MKASTLLSMMIADPWAWVWDYRVQVEFYRLLPTLWGKLDEEERAALTELLLKGLPREAFKESVSPEEWSRLKDRATWERLARVAETGVPLPAEGQKQLAQLEEKYPEWTLTGEDRDDFATWTTSSTGYESDMSAEDLLALTIPKRYEALTSGDYYRDGRLSMWEGVVWRDPMQPFPLIAYMVAEACVDPDILASSFRALAEVAEPTPEMIENMTRVAETVPDSGWGGGIYPFARTVRSLFKKASDPALRGPLFKLWDTTFASLDSAPFPAEDNDILNRAINHPAGHLIEALFTLLREDTSDNERRIPEDIRERFEGALNIALDLVKKTGVVARVLISSRLYWLHWLDAAWARAYIIPLFEWNKPIEKAARAWQAYLWFRRMSPDLWEALRPHFVGAFDHYELLGSKQTNLAEIIVEAYVRSYPGIEDIIRDAFPKIDDIKFYESIATLLEVQLERVGREASTLWAEKVGPFIKAYWPRAQAFRQKYTSINLVKMLLQTRSAFNEAVVDVTPYLRRLPDPHMIIRDIDRSPYPEEYPEATLLLLDAVVSDEARLTRTSMAQILDRIEATGHLIGDIQGRRLREAANRG